GQRLRVLRWPAEDPLNLLQVMLAKGNFSSVFLWPQPCVAILHEGHLMIATKDSIQPQSTDRWPNSARVYVPGTLHPGLRVPLRQIHLQPTKSFQGQIEVNEPVRVYDTSGPWGDQNFQGRVEQGLPLHRREWILSRDDVEPYEGRTVEPRDNGYLTRGHAEYASQRESKGRLEPFPGLRQKPLRAKSGRKVTHMH